MYPVSNPLVEECEELSEKNWIQQPILDRLIVLTTFNTCVLTLCPHFDPTVPVEFKKSKWYIDYAIHVTPSPHTFPSTRNTRKESAFLFFSSHHSCCGYWKTNRRMRGHTEHSSNRWTGIGMRYYTVYRMVRDYYLPRIRNITRIHVDNMLCALQHTTSNLH